ncbi:ATP-dependent DNA ligase [Nocardioides sp.]|uniref:ATP-dependent DNA ligase n=1 Tax=Nocardioides sp. TaxID=35761 RepID=UPI003D0AD1D6
MLISTIVDASLRLASTRSRKAKVEMLAAVLDEADAGEIEVVTSFLSGSLRQRRTGLGWRSLADLPAPAEQATLTVLEVDAAFGQIAALSGAGSQATRTGATRELFARATAPEQSWLRGVVTGEVRQGALDALVQEGLASSTGVPVAAVRRAAMLAGSTVAISAAAVAGGVEALAAYHLEVGRPVQPMLASSEPDLDAALARSGTPAAIDAKLDGIRIQAHKMGDRVLLATRTLEDITARLPEVVAVVASLPVETAVLDGEALAIGVDGRPRPFQETASRTATTGASDVAITPYFFDLLYVDGQDLLALSGTERLARLTALVPPEHLVPRRVVTTADEARLALDEALAAGHEGVVVKSLDAPYDAGRRGAAWVKVKPVHTLDLVVLAVEEGSGRRRGWLSNIHLGARDPEGGFVMLGKTFKGMTDEILRWQTERFTELMTERDDWVVRVRPEQVVEIAFDGVQRSTRYPGGLALRFARVIRYRDDKTADEADTIDSVRRLASWL